MEVKYPFCQDNDLSCGVIVMPPLWQPVVVKIICCQGSDLMRRHNYASLMAARRGQNHLLSGLRFPCDAIVMPPLWQPVVVTILYCQSNDLHATPSLCVPCAMAGRRGQNPSLPERINSVHRDGPLW